MSLIAALEDRSTQVRQAAVNALGQIGDASAVMPVIAALQNHHSYVPMRNAATKALVQFGAPAVKPLISVLEDRGLFGPRRDAIKALVQIGAPAVRPLIAALENENTSVSSGAIGALIQIGAPAVKSLISALEDRNRQVRQAAARALGQIGETSAVMPLVAALEDESGDVCCAAVTALGQIGDASAVMPIIAALQNDNPWVSYAAANALGRMKDTRAVEALTVALKEGNRTLRTDAAKALGQIGDKSAVRPLVASLEDKQISDNDRQSIYAALHDLGWQPDHSEVGAAYLIAQGEWDKCARIGAPAVAPLIAILGVGTDNRGEAAAQALIQIGEPAVEALVSSLKSKSPATCADATKALAGIGWPAVKPLILAFEKRAVDRGDIVKAMGKIGAPAAYALLDIANNQSNAPQVRKQAIDALAGLYRHGRLDQTTRRRILGLPYIKETSQHTDRRDSHHDRPAGCFHDDYPGSHTDKRSKEIVVDFPL
jgi:HEAT repeat protein